MILSKDATRVAHQSSKFIDHMIIENMESYEFSVTPES